MKGNAVPSVWAGAGAVCLAMILGVGGIGALICSVVVVLIAGGVTMAITDPARAHRATHPQRGK